MRPSRPSRALSAAAIAGLVAWPSPGSSQRPADRAIAITNVKVLPMDRERTLPKQSVVVQGGVITRMGEAVRVRIPAGATTIDGSGNYLLPGLADVHVHLAQSPDEQQRALLEIFVANGRRASACSWAPTR